MKLERTQIALLLVLPIAWACVVFAPSFSTDADSYFHVGVARRMVEQGWLREFPWLPHTTLADPFPNTTWGQHAILAPLVALFGPLTAMRVGIVLLSSAFALGTYLVLRRHGARWPAPWIVVLLLACPLAVSYGTFLKGASTFFVLLPWFVDAIWRGSTRRTLIFAWLSVYVYVGATVLVPFALVHVLVVRWLDGRWRWAPLLATLGGLVGGMLVNPLWPAHWGYVAAELGTIFARDPNLVPGEFRGAEWAILPTDMLVQLAGAALLAWGVVIVRRFGTGERASTIATSAAVAAFGLLAGGLFSGTKLVELFVIFSLFALPLLAQALAWRRWMIGAGALVGAALVALSLVQRAELVESPVLTRPRDYEAMAAWLDLRTSPNEMVVVPWDDMPGLFMYEDNDERFVAGYNVQFLRDEDPLRFQAYVLFYRGQISDPQQTMIQFFDGAHLVLDRREPRFAGEAALAASLAKNPAFEELASPNATWRVWRRR